METEEKKKNKKRTVTVKHVYVRDFNRNPFGLVSYKVIKKQGASYVRCVYSVVHPADADKFSMYAKKINDARMAKKNKRDDLDLPEGKDPMYAILRHFASFHDQSESDRLHIPRRLISWAVTKWNEDRYTQQRKHGDGYLVILKRFFSGTQNKGKAATLRAL